MEMQKRLNETELVNVSGGVMSPAEISKISEGNIVDFVFEGQIYSGMVYDIFSNNGATFCQIINVERVVSTGHFKNKLLGWPKSQPSPIEIDILCIIRISSLCLMK